MKASGIVGQILDGKYDIEKQLGKGGMGTVYLATHIGTGRPVAVKVIAPEFMRKAEFVERFRREAKAAGRLRHPNVVDVTDFGFSSLESGENAAYLVMEYLDGCTLGEVLDEEKNLPLEFSIDILEQVSSAVEEAHRQGIIHRDLKPDNIWLEPNQRGGYTVKVLDFGIAKLEEATTSATGTSDEISAEVAEARVIQDKKTIIDGNSPQTYAQEKDSTIVGEGGTVALSDGPKTFVQEAGTMIQENLPEQEEPATGNEPLVISEGGTAIMPSGTTRVEAPEDDKGTRVVSGHIETDNSLLETPGTADLTRVGAVLGTPLYMSPEQCRGEKLTARSDIYSLAVIVYQMLSGKLPFEGDYLEVMEGHKNTIPSQLEAKKVPKKFKKIVMTALAKSPEERPESAESFASKLRSNSEGLGVLLRRSIVIYSERLPKLLLLALLTFTPLIILTLARVGFGFLRVFGITEDGTLTTVISSAFVISTFFLQTVTSAFLVGMTTWIVAQTLAYPLRPVSLRAAFREVKKHWKTLAVIVTLSTISALLAWLVGAIGGPLGWLLPIATVFTFLSKGLGFLLAIVVSILGAFTLGILISSYFMLIAPSIMMEGVKGRAAFGRSIELVKRSFRTVVATATLVYFVPITLALLIGTSVGSVINNVEMKNEMLKMKKEGVTAMTEEEIKEDKKVTNVNIGPTGVDIKKKKKKNEEKSMSKGITQTLREAIFELVWTPIALLISSFTSVITALIYFKTRQAGGESMQGLLSKLDDVDQPQSKWQQRVRERLIQSGKITGNTGGPKLSGK